MVPCFLSGSPESTCGKPDRIHRTATRWGPATAAPPTPPAPPLRQRPPAQTGPVPPRLLGGRDVTRPPLTNGGGEGAEPLQLHPSPAQAHGGGAAGEPPAAGACAARPGGDDVALFRPRLPASAARAAPATPVARLRFVPGLSLGRAARSPASRWRRPRLRRRPGASRTARPWTRSWW